MPEIASILYSFKDFCFISDIQDIYNDFFALKNETQAMLLRRKLQTLKEKPYYHQLNVHKLQQAIYQGLIFLAQNYPLNDEDPITLDEFSDKDSVTISTGHRFQIDSFSHYIKQQSFFQIKNPITNLVMNKQDSLRIIEAIEQKHPEVFKSQESQNHKALLMRTQKFNQSLARFQQKTEEEQIIALEFDLQIQLSVQPIIDTALFHFIMMNYFILIKQQDIPKISGSVASGLIVSNLLSLSIAHCISEKIFEKQFLTANLTSRIKRTLSGLGHLFLMDLFMKMIVNLVMPKWDMDKNHFDLLNSFLFCYGYYLICLQIKYPYKEFTVEYFLKISAILISFYCSSQLIKSIYLSQFNFIEDLTEIESLIIRDHLLYMPLCMMFYTYISELIKTCSRLSKYIVQAENDAMEQEFDLQYAEIIGQFHN